ncbi:hypothetical protein Ahy_B03g066807 [Arachis hypogaea]|uniref:Aminotransferase-like plant mobile domain-containing protein n=1 Tax=Arachis hypogaea TaxID=3818 RepID=A0A445A517_ARAHY|nr:hypothetical protein Ahy_B03g066807 [Arachis hypogaea]
MSGGGVNADENLNRLDELHIAAHLFHKPTRVLTPHGTLVSAGHIGTTKFNIRLKWLRTRLQQMPLDLEDNGLMHWSSAVLSWLYRAICLATNYSVEGMAGCHTLLMSWIYYRLPFWASNVTTLYSFPLATRWEGKKGQNDYAEQRLLRHRLRLDNLQVDEVGADFYMATVHGPLYSV